MYNIKASSGYSLQINEIITVEMIFRMITNAGSDKYSDRNTYGYNG